MTRRKEEPEPESVDSELEVETESEQVELEVVYFKPNPLTHVALENEGYVEHPSAGDREYRISVNARNFEHVSEDENGIWVYRQM